MSDSLSAPFALANKPSVPLGNPLEYANQAGSLAEKLNANRLFQAQTMRGQLLQRATGPDGNVDMSTFNRLAAAAGPGYAPAAAAGLNQSTDIAGQQQAQALKSFGAMATALDSLGPDATYQQVHDKAAEGVRAGWLQPQGANSVLTGMPQGDDPQSKATRAHMLQVMGDQLRSASERLQAQYGRPEMPNTGGQQIPGTVDPRSGAFRPAGAPLTNTMSETDLNGPVDTVDPNRLMSDGKTPNPGYGQKQVITKREMLQRMGVPVPGPAQPGKPNAYNGTGNPLLGGGPSPAPGSTDGNPAWEGQTEGLPGSKATPVGPADRARTAAVRGAPVVTSLSPSQTTEQTALATQGTQAFKEINDQSVAARSRGAVLDNMLADTSQFTSGPGTDVIARVRALANRLNINVNTEGLSAVESFKKLTAALNADQGSDARLAVKEASNPHGDMSPGGLDLMLRQLRGNEDYAQARGKLAAAHPDKTNIAGFEDKTGSQLDPRTFQYDRMTGPQKKTYFNSLPDKAKFVKAHEAAAALLPGGQ